MTAPEIAAALGNPRREGRNWRCRCPIHGGHSLTVRDGRDALLVRCWAGCRTRDVLAAMRCIGLLAGNRRCPATVSSIERRDDHNAARRIAIARRVWGAASDTRGSPVARYLSHRGITIPPPPSLRWMPALRRPDGKNGPAMIGRIDSIEGELIGIARTWLTRGPGGDWRRLDRAMLGCAAGGAVRLGPAAETLMIGEGIETCLAAIQATGLSAWAALSASGLKVLMLPPAVRQIIVLADHDANGAGERAARIAADRWIAEGRRVKLAIPPEPGTDFNDVLNGHPKAGIDEACDVAA